MEKNGYVPNKDEVSLMSAVFTELGIYNYEPEVITMLLKHTESVARKVISNARSKAAAHGRNVEPEDIVDYETILAEENGNEITHTQEDDGSMVIFPKNGYRLGEPSSSQQPETAVTVKDQADVENLTKIYFDPFKPSVSSAPSSNPIIEKISKNWSLRKLESEDEEDSDIDEFDIADDDELKMEEEMEHPNPVLRPALFDFPDNFSVVRKTPSDWAWSSSMITAVQPYTAPPSGEPKIKADKEIEEKVGSDSKGPTKRQKTREEQQHQPLLEDVKEEEVEAKPGVDLPALQPDPRSTEDPLDLSAEDQAAIEDLLRRGSMYDTVKLIRRQKTKSDSSPASASPRLEPVTGARKRKDFVVKRDLSGTELTLDDAASSSVCPAYDNEMPTTSVKPILPENEVKL